MLEEVRRGREVVITYRGKSVAILRPIDVGGRADLVPTGFGMWRRRRDLRNVERWVRSLRAPRFET